MTVSDDGCHGARPARRLDPLVAARTHREYGMKFLKRMRSDAGAATAEYAITIMAAVGFAGLLVVIMKSDAVRGMLTDLVENALNYS